MSDCFCGAGVTMRGDTYVLTSHAPDCLWLCWLITLEADGVCGACGEKLRITTSGGWRRQECVPCGHTRTEWYA